MPDILAVAEQRDGAVRNVSYEVVSAARTVADALGGDVHAVIAGPPATAEPAAELGRFGAVAVHVAEHDAFRLYSPDGFAQTLADFIAGRDDAAVLFPATSFGKDLAPRIAAKLDSPLATDAIALAVEDGQLIITRPVCAGRAFASITLDSPRPLVSLRPNVFPARENPAAGTVERIAVSGDPGAWRVNVREVRAAEGGKLDVGEAPIVVSGGRGMRGPENWHLLEQLRDALGPSAALGASRAVVDAGWRPHAEQVGQTGKTVSPRLYFAIAISGAMQHLAGMRSASTIVAINKDPEAPIFS
ncbi:MAG: electron transfer flavoprotein subunit alpha/FixB family protein, partial [Geminicoccales bacterium]